MLCGMRTEKHTLDFFGASGSRGGGCWDRFGGNARVHLLPFSLCGGALTVVLLYLVFFLSHRGFCAAPQGKKIAAKKKRGRLLKLFACCSRPLCIILIFLDVRGFSASYIAATGPSRNGRWEATAIAVRYKISVVQKSSVLRVCCLLCAYISLFSVVFRVPDGSRSAW